MRPLAARERRLVALALLATAIAVVWLGVVSPLVGGFFDRAAERRLLQASFERNRRLIAALPTWGAAVQSQRRSADRFAIAAAGEQLAVETLKERLQHLAADEGYSVGAIQDLPADASPGRIRIRADMELTLTQLCDSLRRLETEGAYVVVDYLSISADRGPGGGPASPLAVRLELSADYGQAGARPS